MTVNNEASSVSFTGNGVTTVFPYTFRIPEDDMGHVGIFDIATSVLTELAPGTYSIIGVGSAFGGSVTYNPLGVPIPNTKRIVIYRDLDLVQELDLTNQSPYFAETLEETLDRIVMMLQQVSDAAARSIKVTLGSTTSPDALVAQLLATQAAAAVSAAAALVSQNASAISETNAMKWATNPEDTPVTVGPNLYSAFHWAAKAAAIAAFVTNSWLAVLTAFATKATPTDADEFGYRQVSDSTGRKFTWANLKAAVYTAVSTLTAKTIPVTGDGLLLTDSAASGVGKLLTLTNFVTWLSSYFPRFDAAQPVALTQAQKDQIAANIGQGWVVIEEVDITNVASYIRTGLAAYDGLRLEGWMRPATNGAYTIMQFSPDAGATYAATYDRVTLSGVATVAASVNSAAEAGVLMYPSVHNDTAYGGVTFETQVTAFNDATRRTQIVSRTGNVQNAGSLVAALTFNSENAAQADNALRITFSSGNISRGKFRLWGHKG